MKVKSLFAATLGLALGLSALTGVAVAGQPDDPGKSEEAPGQVVKAEHAPEQAQAPASAAQSEGKSDTAPGQTKTETAATPTRGTSATAPGQTKTGTAATPTQGNSAAAKAKVAPTVTVQANGGRSAEAHHHVIICHATGSTTNPFVVINIPMTAWTEAHDVHQDGRDFILKDPASRPGSKDGFTKAACGQVAGVQILPKVEEQAPAAVQVVEEQKQQGGVLGAQAAVKKAKAKPPAAQQGQGGVLGEIAAVPSQELPFTGIQLWIVLLAGIGLLAAGLGARKAMH